MFSLHVGLVHLFLIAEIFLRTEEQDRQLWKTYPSQHSRPFSLVSIGLGRAYVIPLGPLGSSAPLQVARDASGTAPQRNDGAFGIGTRKLSDSPKLTVRSF